MGQQENPAIRRWGPKVLADDARSLRYIIAVNWRGAFNGQ
jgi:hypothetical protein